MTQPELKKLLAAYLDLSSWKDVLGTLADIAQERCRGAQKLHSGRLDNEQTRFAVVQGRMGLLAEVLRGLSTSLSSGDA